MDADIREASLLFRYIDEPHLRTLARRLHIDDYFEHNGTSYVEWIAQEQQTLRKRYGYQPTLAQVRKAIAASILDEEPFFDYLCDVGEPDDLENETTLDRVAHIAAAIIVGLYEDRLAGFPADKQVARGS